MKVIQRLILCAALMGLISACSTSSTKEDGAASPEFSDFDNNAAATSEPTSSEDRVESELNASQGADSGQTVAEGNLDSAEPTENGASDFPGFDDDQNKTAQAAAPPAPTEPTPPVTPPPPAIVEEPAPVPPPEPVLAPASRLVTIKRIQYKANDGGGTVLVEADGPLTFATRSNPATQQFIIEIPNSKLSKKALRPLNTKDFPGGIGSIDPYQSSGSTTSRIVVQLRNGAGEPVVQAEGNSLLIVSGNAPVSAPSTAAAAPVTPNSEAPVAEISPAEGEPEQGGMSSKLLSSASLEEFLGTNQQFYGKKISVESNDADIRDIFKFISDESGVNLVLNEDVKGKVSIKLKQVPWDQALVVIMRAKKLGYQRQGQVLRIARLADLKLEEDEYSKITKNKQNAAPLVVRMIPVSYAKVDDLVKQVTPFLTERGKVISEVRTSAVVVSDTQESIDRVQKLIQSLDVPPAQVLIEGKIVEARESLERALGINWSTTGESINIGTNSRGMPVNMNASQLSVSPGTVQLPSATMNFTLGTLDFLGDLGATLSLQEATGDVKVLSSPRILSLHNEPAEISQVTQVPIKTSTVGSNGVPVPSVTYKDMKLRLGVTPQVSNDASVIMNVDVSREFPGIINDPETGAFSVESRSAKTKVIVRNGQTAVIGGIYQNDTNSGKTRVPGLADIPVLGWLFKTENIKKNKNELLIFLTPRIIAQADSGVSAPPVMAPSQSDNFNEATPGSSGEAPTDSAPGDGGLQL